MNKPAANIIKLLGNDTDDESIYSDEKQNPLTWGTKHSYNDNDAKNNDNYDADNGDENDYDDKKTMTMMIMIIITVFSMRCPNKQGAD